MKRLFDIIVSACGLLVLSPVFLIMAIWIKQDSNVRVRAHWMLSGYLHNRHK